MVPHDIPKEEEIQECKKNHGYHFLDKNDLILKNFLSREVRVNFVCFTETLKTRMLAFIQFVSQEEKHQKCCSYMTMPGHMRVCAPLRLSQNSDSVDDLNPSVWGYLNPCSYCATGWFSVGYLNFELNCGVH